MEVNEGFDQKNYSTSSGLLRMYAFEESKFQEEERSHDTMKWPGDVNLNSL